MTHLMGITLPPGTSSYYHRVACIYNRKVKCIVGIKPERKARKYANTARANSTLKITSAVWKTYNPTLKNAWKSAAVFESKTGYNLFTRDQSFRNKNAIAGSATPSNFHQFFLGFLNNSAAASNLTLKIGRTFRPSAVMSMTINAKGGLTAGGGGGSATLRCHIKRYFIGQTFNDYFDITLDLSSVWKAYTFNIVNGPGSLAACDLYLNVINCSGTLYFDDVELIASGNVLNDDPWCNNVELSAKPVGDQGTWAFSSIYPDDSI